MAGLRPDPLGSLSAPPDSLAAMRRPILVKGREGRKGKGRGRKCEWKEKGKGVPGATIFHLHPCSRPQAGERGLSILLGA